LGAQLAKAVEQGAYSLRKTRLNGSSFQITVCPTDSLRGVVQRKRKLTIPYEFTSSAGDTLRGTGVLMLDQVTDEPDLAFTVRLPERGGL
jgi:hypothetical protein